MQDLELGLQPDETRYTLPHFLEDVVERHADREALRFGDLGLGYRELDQAVRDVARGLVAAGVVKGARVAVWMANRPEWVVATFAAARLGAVVVPVNTFAKPDERDHILRHGDASVLLMQRDLGDIAFLDDLLDAHPGLEEGAPGRLRCPALPQLRSVFCCGLDAGRGGVRPWSELARDGAEVDEALVDGLAGEVSPADDALIIYTSGTTSLPKGVLHAQRAPVVQSWRFAESMGLSPEDRVFTAQPFFWTAGICMSLGATLAAGGCLILEERFEPGRALERIESEGATTVHAWPHQEKAMAEHPDAQRRDLSRVRHVEFSSPLARLAGLEKDVWGTYGSYGLSETFTICSSIPASAPPELRKATSGRTLPGNALRIVDPGSGQPLARGEKGEIAVKGATFMRGYYKVEPERYLDADGYFHTQDGGWIDADGYLHWTGRLSNLIKTGGANVSPLEIEAALSGLPELRVGMAVGVPHPTLGEAVVLCAVPSAGAAPDEEALLATLRAKLAAYKVPRHVLFFTPEELEYTGNQKIQVGPLRDKVLARLAADHVEIAGHRY
ncbi:MAG: class I adenylate-forming enzyme family protein [Myxococcota bacterium]